MHVAVAYRKNPTAFGTQAAWLLKHERTGEWVNGCLAYDGKQRGFPGLPRHRLFAGKRAPTEGICNPVGVSVLAMGNDR
jgi:hypothetical protein